MPKLKQESISLSKYSRKTLEGTETKKRLSSTLFEDDSLEVNFADGYGIIVRDQSLLDVLAWKESQVRIEEVSLLEATKKATMQQPIENTYPPDVIAATSLVL